MPVLPAPLSLEQYEQAQSKDLTEDSFEENVMMRLILAVLDVWIGPCMGLGLAIVQVEGRK